MSITKENVDLAKQILLDPLRMGKFVGGSQKPVLLGILRGFERLWMAEKIMELDKRIREMPKSYEQDGKGEGSIVYLHYFAGGSFNAWITEKDMDGLTPQAFGKSSHIGGIKDAEYCYISIDEIIENGGELDLYFEPKTIKELIEEEEK
jgi:hypothetical protein